MGLQGLVSLIALFLVAFGQFGVGLKPTQTAEERFKEHVERFELKFSSENEYSRRHQVFHSNLEAIDAHNSNPHKTYTMGVNKFTHLTREEFAASLGYGKSYVKGKLDLTEAKSKKIPHAAEHTNGRSLQTKELSGLDEYLDWSSVANPQKAVAVTPVKNQGSCGASWAFAATGALEGAYLVKYGKLPYEDTISPDTGFIGLSEQELLACEQINGGCFVGGAPQYGFMYAADNGGLTSEVDVPYTSGTTPTDVGYCGNFSPDPDTATNPDKPFTTVPPTVLAMMNAVSIMPVAITINAMNDAFQSYNFGTISDASLCPAGDAEHNALLVGWGTDENFTPYWIIKNSWGSDWGDEGYVYILRSDDNVCGVLSGGSYPNLVSEVDTPTRKPTSSPTFNLMAGTKNKLLATPGNTYAQCTNITVAGGDASRVIFDTLDVVFSQDGIGASASDTVTRVLSASRVSGYQCTSSQCLWAFSWVDSEDTFTTTVVPLWVVKKTDSTACAYLQEGFQVDELIPVSSNILNYYMNGWYLNKKYWQIQFAPSGTAAGTQKIENIYYAIEDRVPSAAPTPAPTSKGTPSPPLDHADAWWVMKTFSDEKCTLTSVNSQVASSFGVCTMDTQNAEDYLYWFIDTVTDRVQSKITWQRVYYDDPACTAKSVDPPMPEDELTQTDEISSCIPVEGLTGPYKSFSYEYVPTSLPPAAAFSGYTQTTYTSTSANCSSSDVTGVSVFKSKSYCYSHANRSVTYECDGSTPYINYFPTTDCTLPSGTKANKQAYSPTCFFTVDYGTQQSVSCGTGPVNTKSAASPAIKGYLQTVNYADSFCQTPTSSSYKSYGLCLSNADGTYSIQSLGGAGSNTIKTVITTTTYTDAACTIKSSLTSATSTPLRTCSLTSPSMVTSTQTFLIQGGNIPEPPLYGGGQLDIYAGSTVAKCAASNLVSRINIAEGQCVSVNETYSFTLTCDNSVATQKNYWGKGACSSSKITTKVIPATTSTDQCVATPAALNGGNAFSTMVSATCTSFPTPQIQGFLVQSLYSDKNCAGLSNGGPSGGMTFSSMGLCSKTNANDTYWVMNYPESVDVTATGVIQVTTMRFTDSTCAASKLVGVPFRRTLKVNSCILATQGMYAKMTITGPTFPVSVPYSNGVYTEKQSLLGATSASCDNDKVLTYSAYPVGRCIQFNAYSSVMISCQGTKAVITNYASPTCKAGKLAGLTTSDKDMNTCARKLDTDYTFLATDELLTCTAPTTITAPTATPTRPAAKNATAPDTIQGFITTTHYDSDACTFAINYNADTYGLCMTSVFGGSDSSTVYYMDKVSQNYYKSTVDGYYYYMTRTYYLDDTCTKLDVKAPADRSQAAYYECEQDESGYWTQTKLLRTNVEPAAPAEVNPTKAFTYSIYNDAKCSDINLISKSVVPELTCQLIISQNGTFAYQKFNCVGTAGSQNVSHELYRDENCKDVIETNVYPLQKCSEYRGSSSSDYPGSYAVMSCPYSAPGPTPSPIDASAPTNNRGEIQGWITSYKYNDLGECQSKNQQSLGAPMMSKAQSYGLCVVSNTSMPDSDEYVYEMTTVQPLLMAGGSSHGVLTARVQMITTYYMDELCSKGSNRHEQHGVIHVLANCQPDTTHLGFYYSEYFTSGFLEPADYPSMEAGYQVTVSLYEGCPVEREWYSRTIKVAQNVESIADACIPLSDTSSVSFMCNMDDFYTSTIQYTFDSKDCTGSRNETIIDASDCEMQTSLDGQVFWYTSRCQQTGLSHRVAPWGAAVTAWVSTVYYEDDNCLDASRQMAISYGICTKSPDTTADNEPIYYLDSLGPAADDRESVPLTTFYYSDSFCSDVLSTNPPVTSTIKLHPECFLDTATGFYVTSDVSVGPDFPESAIEGGFKYTTYDTSYGYPYCDAGAGIQQMTFLGDDTCVKVGNKTSVKFSCDNYDLDQNRGLKFAQTRFDNDDCSGVGNYTVQNTEDQCGSAKLESGELYYYTAVCDKTFPTPTLQPRPLPEISGWMVSTTYKDGNCTSGTEMSETVFSFGTCSSVADGVWSITKLDMDTFWYDSVQYSTFYFSDDACSEASTDHEDDSGTYFLYECQANEQMGVFQTTRLVDNPQEPSVVFEGGFVMTSYSADSCSAADKEYAMVNVLGTCQIEVEDGEVSYAKHTCGTLSNGQRVINHYKYQNEDCSDTPVKDIVQPLQTCEESTDEATGAYSYITTECAATFSAPTPAPKVEKDISIQGWVNEIVFSDETCTVPATYMRAYSLGLCMEEGRDDAGLPYYATTQLTDAFTDHVIVTKFFYSTPDCTGDAYLPSQKSTITQIDECRKIQYGNFPATSHRMKFWQGASGALPPGPFTGGYVYTSFTSETCQGKDASFMFVAPDMQCIKFYNGSHYISQNHVCDTTTDSVMIDTYGSDNCGASGDAPVDSVNKKITECSALDDGNFYSVQCASEFSPPTPSPVPVATINTWIQVDHYGLDDKCSEGAVINSDATSYGLCEASSYTDADENVLYEVSVIEGDEETAIKSGEVGVITYYYFDADCTEEASAPDTTTLPFYNCELDDTNSYALSYIVSGPIAPQIPYDKGYTVTEFDSDSCYSTRQMSWTSAAEGYCIAQYDETTKSVTGYTVTCSSTGATINNYDDENCTGTPTKSVDKKTECEATDASDEYTSYFSVECGTFAPPTAAPTRMAPLEIQGWLTTTYFKGTDCTEANTETDVDEFDASSYGLCMEAYDSATDSYMYYIQDLYYDPATPSDASMPVRVFTDEDCYTEDTNIDKEALDSLKASYTNIGECVNSDDFSGSFKYGVTLGPQVPSSPWKGGYLMANYNTDSCSYEAMTDVVVKPNHVCSTKTTDGVVSSYQMECAPGGGIVVYNWAADTCGSSATATNYVVSRQDCKYQDTDVTTYQTSYCLPTFPASPTVAPAPAPTVASIEGFFVEETFADDTCTAAAIDMREVFTMGLCRPELDPHIGLVRYLIEHASPIVDGKITFTQYFYEDSNCAYYRGETMTRDFDQLGECKDSGDGTYYTQSFFEGSNLPPNPFGIVDVVTTTEYAASSCGAGLEIRQSFMKLNTCVNMTEAADYYYYYDKIVGSKVSVCVSDGVEERTFTNPGCQGEYTFEKTIDSSTCAEEANPDDEMYKTWQSVSCNGQGPTSPPSASSGFSTTIQFTVTQVIKGCSYSQEYQTAPAAYDTAIRQAIALSCSTETLEVPTDWITDLEVSAYTGKADSAQRRLEAPGSLLLSYSINGISHVEGTSSQSVAAAFTAAVNDGKFNGDLQEAGLNVGAVGLADASSGKITVRTKNAGGGSSSQQQQSTGTTDEGVSPGGAAGIAIAVIVIVMGLGAGYFYYYKNVTGRRDRKTTEIFSGTNAMFGMRTFGESSQRRPTVGLGNFGDVHRDSMSAGPYGEEYPTLSGTRTNPLRDQIPDPNKFAGRRIGGLQSHEEL